MHSSNRIDRVMQARVLAALCLLVFGVGCTVSDQKAPGLAGPSTFALFANLSATPEALPRDGVSRSIINVDVNNNGQPYANKVLILATDAGTLSAAQVITDANGHATFFLTAPSFNDPADQATVYVSPLQNGDVANVRSDSIRVAFIGPSVPVPSFTISNTNPAVLEAVQFDASATRVAGVLCSTACTYIWDFGDGSNNIGATTNGIVIQHAYSTPGPFLVTLTVTGPSGTSNSVTKTLTVALPAPPVAAFDPIPASPTAPATVTFDASRSTVGPGATITSYVWTFGDGTPGATTTDPAVSHPYNAAGSYNATLYVVDSLGRRSPTTVVTLTVQ
jgi:PKD repeat protein